MIGPCVFMNPATYLTLSAYPVYTKVYLLIM